MKYLSRWRIAPDPVRVLKTIALLNVLAAMSGAACMSTAALAQTTPNDPWLGAPSKSDNFAPVKLRGYGLVSGKAEMSANGSALLRIETESPDKAKLLQAKYLSDFGLQYAVKATEVTVGAMKVAAQEAQGQGLVAALRSGKTVYIVTARDSARLGAFIKTLPADAQAASAAVVEVPMYLDRWDKFNFRHYFRTWEHPPKTTDTSYDFVHEFDWAKEQDRAGFVFWNETLQTDSAEGMMNYGWWEWAANEAAKRSLPVGINYGGESTWLLNEFRDQTQMKMPGFTGNHHELSSPYLGGQGVLDWTATTGQDARLGILQESTRHFLTEPNVTTFLEPHGELRHGSQDLYLEFGPMVDVAYRTFLKEKYGDLAALSTRWGRPLNSWDDVRLQEMDEFEGWGPDAIDVSGLWHVGYETLISPPGRAWHPASRDELKSEPAPADWFKETFDDSAWPQVMAPGNDKALFLVKRPAVYRRSFDVTSTYKYAHPHVYLYVWDLNMATNADVRVVLNGTEVGASKIKFTQPHWFGMDVTDTLRAGKNEVAIRLPQGYLSYTTYLSPVAPRNYPNLGRPLNAQWVDFSDFTQWSRVGAVKRGMEMIRQAAPDHQIVLMSPTAYGDGVKALARKYGGELHDTGAMGAFWDEYPATMSRGGDLPTSVEPGGPADDLAGWKQQWGRWQTEGVQAVDYFIHIGNVLWNPEIKADYEAHRKQISLMGQSHPEKPQTAVLYSDRIAQLTGYPWGSDPNGGFGGGYWDWNAASALHGTFFTDGLTQSSFANGEADEYRVVVDSNTSIMDDSMVADIEKWVRNGGTFITLAQTGRSTPEVPDSWPISRLTGYKVTKIDKLNANGTVHDTGVLQAATDQRVLGTEWNGVKANGLHLEKVAPEARNLLLWPDGTVAVGMRPIGKGFVIQLGAKFAGSKIMDRVEPEAGNDESRHLHELLTALLDWRGVPRDPSHLTVKNEWVWLRNGVTNNGLYDTWILWNWSKDQSQTVSLALEKSRTPTYAMDARTGASFPVSTGADGTVLKDIVLEPLETRVFLTPRNRIAEAPASWFALQRNWWRGTTTPEPKVLPLPSHSNTVDLTPDWKFEPLSAATDVTPMTTTTFNDTAWTTKRLAIWDTKAQDTQRGVFRKAFTVPANWTDGRISLWLTSNQNTSFVTSGRVFLDGHEIKPDNKAGITGLEPASLKPGTSHVLAVDTGSTGVLAGLRGQSWIAYEPAPAPGHAIDLNGQWQSSRDAMTFDAGVAVPGPINAQMLQRSAVVDAKFKGQRAMITVDGDSLFVGVIINGFLVRRDNHVLGERWSVNVTPWVHFGESNDFVLVTNDSAEAKKLTEVHLGFY